MHSILRPAEQIRASVGIRVEHCKPGGLGVKARGNLPVVELQLCLRRFHHRWRLDDVINLGVKTPLEVFGDGGSSLLLAYLLKEFQLTVGIFSASGGAVGVV